MTSFGFKSLPADVTLGPLSRAVFETLAKFTSFPWPVLQAQCKRAGVDPAAIDKDDLAKLVPFLSAAVERFTSPERGAEAALALRHLAHRK